MDNAAAATALAALGHEARLSIFRLLVRAGNEGANIGEIVRHTRLPPSTLSHHLGALVSAGLVRQERRGRETVNRAHFPAMNALLAYVQEECCCGLAEPREALSEAAPGQGMRG